MGSLLITERYLPHQGGSRRYYHELARRLESCVVLTAHEPGEREFDRAAGIRILRRAGFREDYGPRWYRTRSPLLNVLLILAPKWLALSGWTLLEMMRRKPEVLHAGGYLHAGVVARLLGPATRTPYLLYAHGEEIAAASGSRHMGKLMRWVFAGAACVVANSENTARMLAGCGIKDSQVIVARPGVDPARCQPREGDPRARLNLRGEPVLLSVGRLSRQKGFATVIRSLPLLIDRWPDLQYLIIGQGPERASLQSQAHDLGVANRVHFLGSVPDEVLVDAYAAADLFVQPNGEVRGMSEGYGMVSLEAGAAGLAVIGGRSGGVVEAIEEDVTGFLVTPFDERELAEKVALLLQSPELRHRMGEAGRALSRRRGWEQTLQPALQADAELRSRAGEKPAS